MLFKPSEDTDLTLPILYSFRRCPYAIRSRMAIAVSQQQVELREVDLKHKPTELLTCSPKATVPVLQLDEHNILEESLDIMRWALEINDPQNWLVFTNEALTAKLVDENDNKFKQHLDHYKYADRFPENSLAYYQQQASIFPNKLEKLLQQNRYLVANKPTLADIAIFPFIRQFAFVDKKWFDHMPWKSLQIWLDFFLNDPLFELVMKKNPPWKATGKLAVFPET